MVTRKRASLVDERDIKVHIEEEKQLGTKNSSQKNVSSNTKLGTENSKVKIEEGSDEEENKQLSDKIV